MQELFILSLLPYLIYVTLKTKKGLHMLQLNWYNLDNRFVKWIKNNLLKVFINPDMFLPVFFVCLFIEYNLSAMIFITFYLIVAALYIKSNSFEQQKVKFNFTKRVRRLSVTILLIYILVIGSMIFTFDYIYIAYYYLILGLMVYINYIICISANVINKPVEKFVFNYYKTKAKNKLAGMPGLDVVGITGSYGKTSSKNILNDILSIKYNTLPTPKNYNTTYGLILTTNMYLDKFTDMFIAEMGAFKRGEIKELCDLVSPKYGILTSIGEAHLESFGSLENTTKGKFELIESLPSDGCGVLNFDDERQRNYKLKNDCNIITIGINNKDVDYRAIDIKLTPNGSTFNLVIKGDKKKYLFETKLLGKHNIYNILASLALGSYLGVNIERLQIAVKKVKPVKHRLELVKNYNYTIIDDSYNSNPSGCRCAIDVLKLMPGKRIIMTPGMIELGDKQYELNFELGKYIASSDGVDEVVLIGKEQTKPIYEGLKAEKYMETKIHVFNDVLDGFKYVNSLSNKKEEVFVLVENDLPDTFLENK